MHVELIGEADAHRLLFLLLSPNRFHSTCEPDVINILIKIGVVLE